MGGDGGGEGSKGSDRENALVRKSQDGEEVGDSSLCLSLSNGHCKIASCIASKSPVHPVHPVPASLRNRQSLSVTLTLCCVSPFSPVHSERP